VASRKLQTLNSRRDGTCGAGEGDFLSGEVERGGVIESGEEMAAMLLLVEGEVTLCSVSWTSSISNDSEIVDWLCYKFDIS
jgi:hypothetical protein